MIKQHLFNGYNMAKETLDLYSAMQNLNRETIKDYQMLKCFPWNHISVFLIPNMDIREKISIILITAS